jgi:hypothetical protein
MAAMILDAHTLEYTTREELKSSVGRISYTMDLWSDPNLNPFKAVTAHYYTRNTQGKILYRSGLVAFHYTPGSHSGESLYTHLFNIIDQLGVAHKVC